MTEVSHIHPEREAAETTVEVSVKELRRLLREVELAARDLSTNSNHSPRLLPQLERAERLRSALDPIKRLMPDAPVAPEEADTIRDNVPVRPPSI